MNHFTLVLTPYGRQPIVITLTNEESYKSSVDKMVESTESVFSDLSYEAKLDENIIDNILEVDFYVNDIFEQCNFSEGHITFPAKGESVYRKIFMDCYGYVEISLVIKYSDQTILKLHSKYLAVLVKKGELNDTVKAMANYVYQNQEDLLYNGDLKPRDISGLKESNYKSIESCIILAEEIAMIYEISFAYFKVNSRFRIEQRHIVDRFERLQYVNANTLQYIVQHPEQMKQVNGSKGIRYGNRIYHPERTLTTQNIYSTDIYENRIIVGFLRTMINNMGNMIDHISTLFNKIPKVENANNDYVYSSFYIFLSTQKVLEDSRSKILSLKNRFELLWGLYRSEIDVSEVEVKFSPKPSSIFLTVPQYNKIYERIKQWFAYGIYHLSKENYMLSFVKISTLYESYVLTKFIKCLLQNGLTLESRDKYNYPVLDRWKYKNTSCVNTFVFGNDEQKVTLYYQPVIFDNDKSYNNIGIYRNNTISLSSDEEGELKGHYYVPDFLIKIEKADSAKYVICDAKFSELRTIKHYYVSALAFKYLFSLSVVSEMDKLLGMCIIYGQCRKEKDLQTVYDCQLTNKKIIPYAELLPLNENIDENIQFMQIMKVINNI